MRGWLLVAIVFLGGCSCSRSPTAEPEASKSPPTQAPRPQETVAAEEQASLDRARAKNSAALSQAASTLHAYLAATAAKDWGKADAYWVGGKPPPRPDDYSVRGIQDMGSMRIDSETPKPLDEELPTRAVEIPLTLRVQGDTGMREIKGWYRLRRKVSDDGWEITSASMRPSLD
ncbi:MAG: hypothetical protein ACREO0_08390 [Pseudoxanthomonas sp.]